MKPVLTITLYQNTNNADKFYFESATVKSDGNNFIQSNPRPMRTDDLAAFNKAFVRSSIKSRYRSAPIYNVLFCNFDELQQEGISTNTLNLAWYQNPEVKGLFFTKGHSIKTGKYHIPGTVWVFKKGELSVYCFSSSELKPSTKLFLTPFMNIYDNGSVCKGTSEMQVAGCNTIEEAKDKIMTGFYNSEFNHFHQKGFKDIDPHLLYDMMKKGETITKFLTPTDKTVHELCLTL